MFRQIPYLWAMILPRKPSNTHQTHQTLKLLRNIGTIKVHELKCHQLNPSFLPVNLFHPI